MTRVYAEIGQVLAAARRRQGWILLGAALGRAITLAACLLLVGSAAIALGAGPATRPVTIAAAALSAIFAFAWATRAFLLASRTDSETARTVGTAEPGLASDLVTSVELHREYGQIEATGRFSLALVDEHLARSARRAVGVDLRRVVSSRPFRSGVVVLGAAILLHLAVFALAGKPITLAYVRLLGGAFQNTPPSKLNPITSDIEITYLYPAHMHRPTKTLSGTSGDVLAPKGTDVRLKTRADRSVSQAELSVVQGSAGAEKRFALEVSNGRDLSGNFAVEEGGSYRFRLLDGGKEKALGPPMAIAVEPDTFPAVTISEPAPQVEVDAKARVRVEWTASDDYGLGELVLVMTPGEGEEQHKPLRDLSGSRREAGAFDLDMALLGLAEGESVLYYLEVRDNDEISGPKRATSATQVVKIFSAIEHHRVILDKAQALWEELVALLGDRLVLPELPVRRSIDPKSKLDVKPYQELDDRLRRLHQSLREASAAIRKERSAPKGIAEALANVAGGLRLAEERLSPVHKSIARSARFNQRDLEQLRRANQLGAETVWEMERDVLYLEQLFDKRRVEDLIEMAKDLTARRRELAGLLEKYRSAPTEAGRRQIMAEIGRLRRRMEDVLRRMGELAKGLRDEHMNAEALAELAKSKDLPAQLDEVEKMIANGDVDGALKALDSMGNSMQSMLSQLKQTASIPDQKNAAMMKRMREFQRELEALSSDQEQLARETDRKKTAYKRAVAERMRTSGEMAKRLATMARESMEVLSGVENALTPRTEDDFAQSRDRLADLERALAMRDFDAALDSVRRALGPMQRLARDIEEDVIMAEHYKGPGASEPKVLHEAQRRMAAALSPARKVKEELENLFPDPRRILSEGEQKALQGLAKRQQELQARAGGVQQQLEEMMRVAPIFPPTASQTMGESRGHMAQAAGELGQKNAQRGYGEQRLALERLQRLKKGLEEAAKKGGDEGAGFPFPFADAGEGERDDGRSSDLSRDKVEIPGAEAYRPPEEYRKDLLEAMKQGAPESYKTEVRRYYEELVK